MTERVDGLTLMHQAASEAWKNTEDRPLNEKERLVYGVDLAVAMGSVIQNRKSRKLEVERMLLATGDATMDFLGGRLEFFYAFTLDEEVISMAVDGRRSEIVLNRNKGKYTSATIEYEDPNNQFEMGLNAVYQSWIIINYFDLLI
jgi:hypothetical protein